LPTSELGKASALRPWWLKSRAWSENAAPLRDHEPYRVYSSSERGAYYPHDLVHTIFVKNVTISLPEAVLENLREQARREKKSLNQWLRELLSKEASEDDGWAQSFLTHSDELARNEGARIWNREDAYAERLR